MQTVFNELIRIIKWNTPADMNPVDMLIRIAPMSKEAAYRRLRGEIDFSLDEVVRIVRFFNVSLDGLLSAPEEHGTYNVQMICVSDRPSVIERYSQSMKEAIDLIQSLKKQPNPVLYALTDMLIPAFSIYKYKSLEKFYLYKWLYRWDEELSPVKMKDFSVPDEVVKLHYLFMKEVQDIAVHYICPPEWLLSHVREVGFFRKMNLLTDEEVEQIKRDTNSLLDRMEHNMIKGKTSYGAPFSFFLTNMGYDSTYVYYQNDGFGVVSAYMFGDGFYYFRDSRIVYKMKKTLERLIKNSTLITVSGEKQRIEFMQRQREMVMSL